MTREKNDGMTRDRRENYVDGTHPPRDCAAVQAFSRVACMCDRTWEEIPPKIEAPKHPRSSIVLCWESIEEVRSDSVRRV